jgi:hypothetical protein
MFRIVNLRNNIVWPDEKGESERIFENGDDAAKAAKYLNEIASGLHGWQIYVPRAHELSPYGSSDDLRNWFEGNPRIHPEDKWQVRKILKNEDWKKIQAEKIATGTFKPVPWHTHPKWIEWSAKAPQCDHFVHCSIKDQNAIAYTKNAEAGQMDIRTRISPSKYFEKFVKGAPSDYYISEWLAIWTKYVSASELKFATTRSEIRKVYELGPDSCMSGERGLWGSSIHPVEAYAAGDLAIAYLLRRNGRINARAVVWPEKKLIGRQYGGDATLLANLLKGEGYTSAGSFENARLLAIDAEPYTKKQFTFICPYIDPPSQYISFDENEKVLRLHNKKAAGRLGANTQGGYVAFPLPFLSEFSGRKFCSISDPPVTVYVSQKKTQIWATSEVSEHAYSCYLKCRVYSRKDCFPTPIMVDSGVILVSPFALDKLKIIKCGYYGYNVFYQETENVVVGYEPDGSLIRERWHKNAPSFLCGEKRYAVALRSRLPWTSVLTADIEHRHPTSRKLGLPPATYPCRVTRENADLYLRRAFFDPTGKWAVKPLAEGPRE